VLDKALAHPEAALRKILFSLLFLAAIPAFAADKAWPIDETLGKPDAPITIVEYASLTCSHCAEFEAKVWPQLKKDWLDTGKAKLVYRDYVWDPMAEAAAMISHCAGHDRYFAFVETFFHSQANWLRSDNPMNSLKGIARLGGMPEDKVDACLQDKSLLNQILARKDDAEKLYSVHSTPTFVINGKVQTDVSPDYQSFVQLLK
jgi:protein-disulfide isomerase